MFIEGYCCKNSCAWREDHLQHVGQRLMTYCWETTKDAGARKGAAHESAKLSRGFRRVNTANRHMQLPTTVKSEGELL